MFDIRTVDNATIQLIGRLDAAQAERFGEALSQISQAATLDCSELEYISSAGLGELFAAQKRLMDSGAALKLTNLSEHLREVFGIAGFDQFFELE